MNFKGLKGKYIYPFPKLIWYLSPIHHIALCSTVLGDNNLGSSKKKDFKKRLKESILPSKIKVILSRGETVIIFKCVCQRTIYKLWDIAENNKVDIFLSLNQLTRSWCCYLWTPKWYKSNYCWYINLHKPANILTLIKIPKLKWVPVNFSFFL